MSKIFHKILPFFFIVHFSLLTFNTFSQFDQKQEKRLKLADDSTRKKDDLFVKYQRIHYGLLIGVHQGKQTNIELGLHRTNHLINGIYAFSVSYEYNINNKINGLYIGTWAGAFLGAGFFAGVNSLDFKKYSMTMRPMAGIEYYYVGLYYSYNINFLEINTPEINTHALTFRVHLAFITKKGHGITKW